MTSEQSNPTTYNFKVHPTTLQYALPLSKFKRLPSNTGKEVCVGLIIIGKGYEGDLGLVFRGREEEVVSSNHPDEEDKEKNNSTSIKTPIKPKALLIRPIPAESLSTQDQPNIQDDWNLPSIPAILGTDQTLLETIARCAKEKTGREVKAISRFLGSGEYTYADRAGVRAGVDLPGDTMGEERRGESVVARRFDFAIKLYPGPVVLKQGWEGKWVDTEESWRVMQRVSEGGSEGGGQEGEV